jgi:hypothetical protein
LNQVAGLGVARERVHILDYPIDAERGVLGVQRVRLPVAERDERVARA